MKKLLFGKKCKLKATLQYKNPLIKVEFYSSCSKTVNESTSDYKNVYILM